MAIVLVSDIDLQKYLQSSSISFKTLIKHSLMVNLFNNGIDSMKNYYRTRILGLILQILTTQV